MVLNVKKHDALSIIARAVSGPEPFDADNHMFTRRVLVLRQMIIEHEDPQKLLDAIVAEMPTIGNRNAVIRGAKLLERIITGTSLKNANIQGMAGPWDWDIVEDGEIGCDGTIQGTTGPWDLMDDAYETLKNSEGTGDWELV
jgi:hypothetical protein